MELAMLRMAGRSSMKMKMFIVVAAIAVMLVAVHAGAEKKADDAKKEDLEATIAEGRLGP